MLTVAISTHEGYAKWLSEAVRSAQRHADRVVVYSDGELSEKPQNVSYVELPKTGYCVWSRRRAILDCTTDYLLNLDADDWLIDYPPEVGDIAYSNVYLCDESSAITGTWDYTGFPTDPKACMDKLRNERTMPVCSKMVLRMDWLREHDLSWYQWPNTTFGEDVRTVVEYLKHSPQIVKCQNPFYVYRLHGEQDTRNDERRAVYLADLDAYLKGDSCTETSTP